MKLTTGKYCLAVVNKQRWVVPMGSGSIKFGYAAIICVIGKNWIKSSHMKFVFTSTKSAKWHKTVDAVWCNRYLLLEKKSLPSLNPNQWFKLFMLSSEWSVGPQIVSLGDKLKLKGKSISWNMCFFTNYSSNWRVVMLAFAEKQTWVITVSD